jgi:hypothetical protein
MKRKPTRFSPDKLIELAMLPDAFAHLLQKGRTRISEHEYERALDALQRMKTWRRRKSWLQFVRSNIHTN